MFISGRHVFVVVSQLGSGKASAMVSLILFRVQGGLARCYCAIEISFGRKIHMHALLTTRVKAMQLFTLVSKQIVVHRLCIT